MMTTSRNMFVGSHVTKPVKTALIEEAAHKGISVSRLVYRILLKHFKIQEPEA